MRTIKLGGSIMGSSLSEFDPIFFDIIKKIISYHQRTTLIIGGGVLCRHYQQSFRHFLPDCTDDDLHYVGIDVLNMNAAYIRRLLPCKATYPRVITTLEEYRSAITQPYLFFVQGAEKPGHSSDRDAALVASVSGKHIERITNVDAIYTADPRKDPYAQKISLLNWKRYLSLIGNPDTHEPGASYPIDPIASRMCDHEKITMKLYNPDGFLTHTHGSYIYAE